MKKILAILLIAITCVVSSPNLSIDAYAACSHHGDKYIVQKPGGVKEIYCLNCGEIIYTSKP